MLGVCFDGQKGVTVAVVTLLVAKFPVLGDSLSNPVSSCKPRVGDMPSQIQTRASLHL